MLKYYNNNSNHHIINIDLELIRYKCFLKIQKSLQYLITKYFDSKLFSKKKNYNITINNIFSSLIFSQYIYKNPDIFIPKLHNIDIFKKTIKHYIKNNINMISKLKDFMNEFIKIYKDNYYYFLKKTKNIYTYNYNITTTIVNVNNIKYVNFKNNIIIYNKYLKSIINNIFISYDKYIYLKNKYNTINKTNNDFDKYLFILLIRYKILFSNNNQLAILPNIIKLLKKDFNLNFETFGSFNNVSSDNFCSLYYDIERYFGSIGNFFNTTFYKGFYLFNPPFQEDIIIKGINNIFDYLDKSKEKLGFFISIPIWDKKGKQKYNIIDDYNDFSIIDKIKKSKYLKLELDFNKNEFSYLDHFLNKKKNVTIQNTYIFILANYNNNFDIIKNYTFL